MSIDIAVVPVAGMGTRLLPATKSQPKEMLPVGRKPVVQYVVEELTQSGINRLLFITGASKTSIENHFDTDERLINHLRETGREEELQQLDFERRDVEYFYTRQRRQLGLGHAVLCAKSLVGSQPFVVALGDSIIGINAKSDIVQRMTEEFESSNADIVVAFEEVPKADVVRYGIAKPRGVVGTRFELDDLIEKPSVEEAPSTYAVASRYVLSPAIFEALETTEPGKGGEIQLTDAIRILLKRGAKGVGLALPPDERRFDIGNYGSYFRAFADFALADPDYGDQLRDYLRGIL
ncbi:MAG: UTP--glucose-1-phosphate uridylyltransferase [Planctomycetota bacterium]|nr:UTP--glucose-1-phosphate uridylyltransferase [Planctomycetota bacterium]MDA0918900.1 UTP--glucose-1-phosphate uridylyltransferase [Planctomycetota bacterium]MDA1161096.1 UTP--glucose-1-phosphate uridylyltransferase [Planctomycetota bacterium]